MASWSAQKSECVLLFLGLHLFQAVLGTTVIPLCGLNETDRCTTALVQTESTPQVAEVLITSCKSDMQNYCFNGQCVYIVDLKQHFCKCNTGYFGVRCGHSSLELVYQPLSNEYLALTVLMVFIFFLAVSVGIYFFYRWYENKKQRLAANRSYAHVATDTALLHV